MTKKTIDRLIINSPYEEPAQHWNYHRESRAFSLKDGRRPAGYVIASESSRSFDDPGIFVQIPLVNLIRPRIQAWREAGYPGVTGITKRLLEYWQDKEEFDARRFFFCQLEAAETLIWLTEAPESDKVGVDIPSDGGEFLRLCTKLATGGGKTLVMAMAIAWQTLNKVAYPQDKRFSKHILIVAPGLTVKSRLSVLEPSNPENYFEAFRIVPPTLMDQLRQGKVIIRNWHILNWETTAQIKKKRSVDKRGARSDEAYVRDVLGDIARHKNILVINDEAHHAWRVPSESKVKGVQKDEIEEATKWIGGLDRIHKTRGVLACLDFSATPFAPSGKQSSEEALFGWIVSDFSLNDAIESGLVKTPRVVVRDDAVPDAKTYKSRLYHIYNDPEVRDDLARKAAAEEPLPDLVNHAYHLLGYDWLETARAWESQGYKTPPVMITVANHTHTAARVRFAFDNQRIKIKELCNPERTLHIDSKVLDFAETAEEPIAFITDNAGEAGANPKLTKKEQAELLRRKVDSVGRVGEPGGDIQNVISVQMLSEGWDAKTVTHIMGLRAFSSQLLCEQVVGRGLRRTSYEVNPQTGLFEAEYVNIFGIPFTFLPHESAEGVIPPPPKPKTAIEPDSEKVSHELRWPNVIRIDRVLKPNLTLDLNQIETLELNASNTPKIAELAPVIEGKPDYFRVSKIDLEKLAREYRMQRIIFETARDLLDQIRREWVGSDAMLIAQLIKLVEKFVQSEKIRIIPKSAMKGSLQRRLIITLNMTKIVQHISNAIRFNNVEQHKIVVDRGHPISSTGDMRTWYTSKPCEHTERSHINFCVCDSAWESTESFVLDNCPEVDSWAKNDHLGFEIFYIDGGIVRKYRPDFLIRFKSGQQLILETKGKESERDRTKRKALDDWVQAINEHGGFGQWSADISRDPADISDILESHAV